MSTIEIPIPLPKDEYFENYINDPKILELYNEFYCKQCIKDPKVLKKIRRAFEKDIRSFLKEDYPDKLIEGTEIFDGQLVNCWYEYNYDNQVEFLN